MSESTETLFDRVGGTAGIGDMVDEFYGLVMADRDLRPFFENTSLDKLKHMQKEFFAAALDGPMTMGDPDLARVHQGLGITRKEVTRFVNHLITVLDNRHSIERRDAMDIVFRIATYTDEVIGDSGGADG